MYTNTHLLTLILSLFLTAECLMTGGSEEGGGRRIQQVQYVGQDSGFLHSLSLLKDNMYICSHGCVWSHKQQQKGTRHTAAYNANVCLVICELFKLFYFSCNIYSTFVSLFEIMFFTYSRRGRINLQQSHCCTSVSNCFSIHAADLYPSGTGSSDLDQYIHSQETKVIST